MGESAWPRLKGTIILKAVNSQEEERAINCAASILKKGGIVAFPTETVYGLGGNALDPQAIREIYRVKKRPPDNPLIVHVTGMEQAARLVASIPEEALLLAEHFWPGPLTLIFAKKESVPDIITAGLSSVALRVPAHPLALNLIHRAGFPLAAPSANLSGRPSPTTAEHVLEDLAGSIAAVLDGGPCTVGVESTVLSLLSRPPALLRPGGVTLESLEAVLGTRIIDISGKGAEEIKGAPYSPGMKYRHYAPRVPLYLVEGQMSAQQKKIKALLESFARQGLKVGLMIFEESRDFLGAPVVKVLSSRNEPHLAAERLFAALRELDSMAVDVIVAEGLEEYEMGRAIMNRLRKAATKIIKAGAEDDDSSAAVETPGRP